MSIALFLLQVNFGLKFAVRKFSRIFGLICSQIFIGNYIDTISILLGKKLHCVKVFSIAKAVKAKQYSPKISKIWLIRCDIQYSIIKNKPFDFRIWTYNVVYNFNDAEAGILNLFLI